MAIISNVSKFPITLTSQDGDSWQEHIGKNIPVADKFLDNILPGIVVVKGVEKKTANQSKPEKKKSSKKWLEIEIN